MKNLSLYIHIPFCQKKCHYCDFLSAPASKEEIDSYVDALMLEIKREGKEYQDYFVDTVFMGGGTPSLLSADKMGQLLETLQMNFRIEENVEITMEINPGTVNMEKLDIYRKGGVNRLSVGLQSANNQELKELGRIHTWEEFLSTWTAIRECGFDNVNIDLMSALPGQTTESYEKTLKKVLELEPEHISSYSLMIEEQTLFFERFSPGKEEEHRLPHEEEDRRMYETTERLLKAAGYERYEISNYSRPGFACLHNTGYWTGKEYLGLGLGASSLINHRRFSRESKLGDYVEKVGAGKSTVVWQQNLSIREQMEEFMFLGLRMTEGILRKEFYKRFGVRLEEKYGRQIKELTEKGLLYVPCEGRLALTPTGVDVSNQVFIEFLS